MSIRSIASLYTDRTHQNDESTTWRMNDQRLLTKKDRQPMSSRAPQDQSRTMSTQDEQQHAAAIRTNMEARVMEELWNRRRRNDRIGISTEVMSKADGTRGSSPQQSCSRSNNRLVRNGNISILTEKPPVSMTNPKAKLQVFNGKNCSIERTTAWNEKQQLLTRTSTREQDNRILSTLGTN